MKSHGSKAARDRKWREKLARRNAPRGVICLPPDVKLSDIDFQPDFAERGFTRLAQLDADFAKKEIAYLRAKCKAYEAIIAADKKAE